MPSIGTCFRFYTQMRVQKKTKLLPIKLKTVYTTVHISSSLEKESQVCHLTSSPIPTGEGKLCPPYYYWHPQFFWASTMPAMFMRFSESVTRKADNLSFMFRTICESIKVHIFWEGLKILRNLHLTFFLCSAIQKSGGDFEKFCGLLRIYEL